MTDIEEIPFAIEHYRNCGHDDMALPDWLYVIVTECPNAGCEARKIAEKRVDVLLIDEKPFWTDDVDPDEYDPCGYDVEVYFPTLAAAEEYARKLRASGYTEIDCHKIDREHYCRAYLFRSDNSIAANRQPRQVETPKQFPRMTLRLKDDIEANRVLASFLTHRLAPVEGVDYAHGWDGETYGITIITEKAVICTADFFEPLLALTRDTFIKRENA